MDRARLVVGDAPGVGPGAKRYALECDHGRTWAVVLPARSGQGSSVALDMLTIRHDREIGCRCSQTLRPSFVGVARA